MENSFVGIISEKSVESDSNIIIFTKQENILLNSKTFNNNIEFMSEYLMRKVLLLITGRNIRNTTRLLEKTSRFT